MEVSRQEYWSGLPFPSPGDLPDQGLNLCLLNWQAGSLPLSHLGSPFAFMKVKVKSLSRVRLFAAPWLLHPWDFPGKSTGVGCHFLLQGIFPTQGLNPGLPHCRQTLYRLSHQGSHRKSPGWVRILRRNEISQCRCKLVRSWSWASVSQVPEPP